MFRQRGRTRTHQHNKSIASLLSFIAGFVNSVGILSVFILTTNVTGHFGFLMDVFSDANFKQAFIYFLFIFCFFLGSFISNLLIEIMHKVNERYIYILPASIEFMLLIALGLFGKQITDHNPNWIAFILLFAMGLQNALVTIISNAIIRTTHLTGLFTDLGIEISQIFFYKSDASQKKLKSNIGLRFRIILYFFFGGIIGGGCFDFFGFYALLLPAFLLLLGMSYDYFKFKVLSIGHKMNEVKDGLIEQFRHHR